MNYGNIIKYWRTVLVVAEMSIRMQFSDGFVLFAIVFQPMIIAVLALFMLKDKGGDYAMFVVVGSGLTGLWSSLLFVSGNSINVERWIGTLESLIGMPTPFDVIVFGKNLANVFQSLLSMVVSYMLAACSNGKTRWSSPFISCADFYSPSRFYPAGQRLSVICSRRIGRRLPCMAHPLLICPSIRSLSRGA